MSGQPDPALCPEHLKDSLTRYASARIPTGGFLEAVLENDLREAIGRADSENLPLLPHIVSFVYNNLPSASWGSPERVNEWLAGRKA